MAAVVTVVAALVAKWEAGPAKDWPVLVDTAMVVAAAVHSVETASSVAGAAVVSMVVAETVAVRTARVKMVAVGMVAALAAAMGRR